MDYIITLSDGRYFCGWDTLDGSLKFIHNRSLAYRMRRAVAVTTLEKVCDAVSSECRLEKIA